MHLVRRPEKLLFFERPRTGQVWLRCSARTHPKLVQMSRWFVIVAGLGFHDMEKLRRAGYEVLDFTEKIPLVQTWYRPVYIREFHWKRYSRFRLLIHERPPIQIREAGQTVRPTEPELPGGRRGGNSRLNLTFQFRT